MTDDELRADSAQLEQMLAELRDIVPLPAWQRFEEVLRRVVRLYGAGLARAIAHARDAGANGEFDARLDGDELLASLLVLHGLHPLSTEARVHRALDHARAELGLPRLELASLHDGALVISADDLATGAMSPQLAEGILRRALEAAAPELVSITIAGLPPRRDPTLVQLRTRAP